MQERILGVHWPFIPDAAMRRLEANPFGFTVRRLPLHPSPADMAPCEIVFGTPDPAVFRDAVSLRWLATPSAGVEPYLDPTLYPNPILLTNSSGGYGVGISEFLLTTTLMLYKRMPEYYEQQLRKVWRYIGQVRAVQGARVTVVGLGDIGSEYARRMHALGAVVTGVRRHAAACPPYCAALYPTDRLDEALADADIVALCLPGTKETAGIMDRRRLESLKPGCVVLNIGRGSALDQDALIELLHAGRLGGAALDVAVPEPLPADHPLWNCPNLILTPHVSGNQSLPLTLERIGQLFYEELERYAAGQPLLHLVDRALGY